MNLVLPLQLGIRDVAFPTLNSLSLWLTAAGVLLVNYKLKSDRRARTEQLTEHLALLEMRQERIFRIRDVSAPNDLMRRLMAHYAPVSGAD